MFKKLSTLLLLFLAFGMSAKAAVIITDPTPDSSKTLVASSSSWFSIDFNTDGIEDYNFGWSFGRFGGGRVYCYGPGDNKISQSGTSSGGAPIITAIDTGVIIDASHTWADAASIPEPLIHDDASGGTVAFVDSGTKYIGVRFKIGTNTHYGWVKVSYTSSSELTVMSYGYESTPSTGLPAGSPTGLPVMPPIAIYTSSATTTDTKSPVVFRDASLHTPTAWEWTFTPATVTFIAGTGPASQNPQVLFNAAGKYTVKLKVTNTAGSDSATKTDYVTVITAPAADFSASTVSTDTKTTVTFTDMSANVPTAWKWTFTPATVTYMGGTGPNSQHPQVRFDVDGKYTVKLRATNTAGSDSVTKTDYMAILTAPAVDFTASTVKTDTRTTVTFTDMSTNAPTAWEWTFAPATVTYMGGTGSLSQNPQVQFNVPGKYTVTLKAGNASGSNAVAKTDYMTIEMPTGLIHYGTGGNTVQAYPNPAGKVLIIENLSGKGMIRISDITGKTELSQSISSKRTELDISQLPKGHHILNIAHPYGTETQKLLIE